MERCFSSGWRRVHNPITGHDATDDLTAIEFAIAMWKLNVTNRKNLKQYMLE